jgi:hypothetical protein
LGQTESGQFVRRAFDAEHQAGNLRADAVNHMLKQRLACKRGKGLGHAAHPS